MGEPQSAMPSLICYQLAANIRWFQHGNATADEVRRSWEALQRAMERWEAMNELIAGSADEYETR